MKKVGMIILTVIMLVCSLAMVGCKDKATDENSYRVSFYEEVYTQDEHGVVTLVDYKLNKSFTVLKTQMFEFENYGDSDVYGPNQYHEIIGEYDGYWPGDKFYILPESDMTIFFEKARKKTIAFYYNNKNLFDNLSDEEKEEYESEYIDTYETNFYIGASWWGDFTGEKISNSFKLEFYTNKDFEGEPFEEVTISSWASSVRIHLIQSTNVYIKKTIIA